MQIHDWALDEADLSLTALPAADSEENRLDKSHTPGSASFRLKCRVREVRDRPRPASTTEMLFSVKYIFSISQQTELSAADHRTADEFVSLGDEHENKQSMSSV